MMDSQPQFDRLRVRLYPGKDYPNGASGTVQVASLPTEVAILATGARFDLQPDSKPSKAGRITKTISFRTVSLQKFNSNTVVEIRLESASPLSKDVWTQLEKRVVVSFE